MFASITFELKVHKYYAYITTHVIKCYSTHLSVF